MLSHEVALLNIAIVEDNSALRESLVDVLADAGHHVTAFGSAEAFERNCSLATVDIVLLDLTLPGEDGIELATRLRKDWPKVGMVMLTARGSPTDRQLGYERGADIYLTKPSSAEELTSSITSLARRLNITRVGNRTLVLDPQSLTLTGNASTQALTAHEAFLLEAFIRAPGNRLENQEIAQTVGQDADWNKGAIGVKIVRLRKKIIAAGAEGQAITAVRNFGYQLSVPIQLG